MTHRRRVRVSKKQAPKRWTPISPAAAEKLAEATSTPGVLFPAGTNSLPAGIQGMPGATSYFISGYPTPLPLGLGITAGGEMVVVRTEGNLGKGYNYLFGTSSNGQVCINGPYKDFSGHHFPASSAIAVSSLFGHHPFGKK